VKCKCKKCGKFIREREAFCDGHKKVCGDCAIKEIIKIHGVSYDQAYHRLEQIQFGNGYSW
jgi:hypothetical protein